MSPRAPALLGGAAALLVLSAAAVVASSSGADDGRTARGAEFQRLVGGLGLGPATDLARCERSFDARIDGACAEQVDLVPGGALPCGHGGAAADR